MKTVVNHINRGQTKPKKPFCNFYKYTGCKKTFEVDDVAAWKRHVLETSIKSEEEGTGERSKLLGSYDKRKEDRERKQHYTGVSRKGTNTQKIHFRLVPDPGLLGEALRRQYGTGNFEVEECELHSISADRHC